jgi:hypothetical protein
MASRLGLLARPVEVGSGGSGSPADFLSFDPPPCVQLGGRDDLRRDVGGRDAAGTGGVLMGPDHRAVHPDRPVRTFGHIGLSTQRVQDPSQRAVA